MGELAFTEVGYRRVLATAQAAGYRFLSFDDPTRDTEGRVCLLRHDVDADLGAAARMARLEAEAGVKSTYFVMLRSPLYNLLGRANLACAREIVALGHYIGLHYDHGFRPGEHMNVAQWIDFEAGVLSRSLDAAVTAVSFHQPGPEVLEGHVDTGRLVNAYSRSDMKGFHYVSDSNRQWRDRNPLTIFESGSVTKLHLLIHPMWWIYGDAGATEDVWDAVVLANVEQSQRQLEATERAYGAPRHLQIARGRAKPCK